MPDFLVTAYDEGVRRDVDSFLLPENAFSRLEDAYVWRGRVKKRRGFTELGRLRRVIAATVLVQTTGVGVVTDTIVDLLNDGSINLRATEPNAEIQPGSVTITTGAPDVGSWQDNVTNGVMTATGGIAVDGTINYVTGQIVLNYTGPTVGGGAITATFNYYPSFPVMGLRTREIAALNAEQTIAFDQIYAYRYVLPGGWEELPSNLAVTWSGNNSQFFWTTNYRGTLASESFFWVTNFNQGIGGGDPIYYYDPNAAPATWVAFLPIINGGNELHQCKIILPFKNRLVCFNTWEGATLAASVQYPQRARWSINGDPTNLATSWLDNVVGAGGYIDAPTSEHIISAEIIKDRIIVFFERSTWEFVYTGNEILPFVWKNINTELGSESTFSGVVFDDGLLAVGNVGIHSSNIGGTEKINLQIPDFAQEINNSNNGYERVYGIRDFNNEMVYWTYPSFVGNPAFPNRVLAFNYRNNSYSFFRDRMTCYGYFQKTTNYTWATLPYSTWSSWNVPWNAAVGQAAYLQIIAGNQQGFVHLFDDSGTNDISLSVTAIAANTVTAPNHNLEVGQYVKFQALTGITITPVGHSTTTYLVLSVPNANQFTIDGTAAGVYPGGGFIIVLNYIDIRSKNFALYISNDLDMRYKLVDFLFTRTTAGEVDVRFYISNAENLTIDPLIGSSNIRTYPEDNKTLQPQQNKIWHTIYPNYVSNFMEIGISLTDEQIRDDNIIDSEFEMHAIRIDAIPGDKLR
jgi:hypothetical protein